MLKVNCASAAPAALFVNPENATEMLPGLERGKLFPTSTVHMRMPATKAINMGKERFMMSNDERSHAGLVALDCNAGVRPALAAASG